MTDKFRVYHKDSGSMEYGFDLVAISQYLNKYTDEYIKKNIVVMRWTGLKDKHHKEIYQGDIIPWFDDMKYIMSGRKDKTMFNHEVVWRDGAFWLEAEYDCERDGCLLRNCCYGDWDDTGNFEQVLYHDIGAGEIIGNICEKPELMNEKQ